MRSGTQAAALGGFTAVHAMANTDPAADTAGVVEQVWRLGRQAGHCDVQPVGAVTAGLAGSRLAELGAMADSAARVRVFSDDGNCVSDARLMRRALEYVKAFDGVIAQHAQEPRLTEGAQMNEGEVSAGSTRPDRLAYRGRGIGHRLATACWPRIVGSALHISPRLHRHYLGGDLLRWAKSKRMAGHRRGDPASPAAHRRLKAEGYDPVYKVNPPLRTQADVAAAWQGLPRSIDCVANGPCPAPAGGQGDRVGDRRLRHDRPGDGVKRVVQHAMRGHRHARLGRGRRPDVTAASARDRAGYWPPTATRRPRCPRQSLERCATRSPGRPWTPARSRVQEPQQPVRGAGKAGPVWWPRSGERTELDGISWPRCRPAPRCWSWRTAARSAGPGLGADGEAFGEMALNTGKDRLPGDADRPVLLPPDRFARPRRTSATPASTTTMPNRAGSGSAAT